MRTRTAIALLLVLLGLLAGSACDDGDDDASRTPQATSLAAPMLRLAPTPLGDVVVAADGSTLYVFMRESGGKSACEGECAQLWPPVPLPVGAVTVGAGLDIAKVGSSDRPDGTKQLTYGGAPLYRYARDSGPGQTTGQGVGSVWFVVGGDGKPIITTSPTTTATASPGY